MAEIALLAALILFALIRPFILEPFYIPSNSMVPIFQEGDRILANKLTYRFKEPERGEIVVFYGPETWEPPMEIFIKRIVALPGEHVSIYRGKTYVEGLALPETYLESPPVKDYGTIKVPEDSYFVMGDNRNASRDSRYWGVVPRDHLIGRAVMIFWPLHRLHVLP